MIFFKFKLTDRRKEFHNEKYSYVYEYDGDFSIFIGKELFFDEPGMPILEFFRDVNKWRKIWDKSKNMFYNCVETEDNPLISFININNDWVIHSPWQKFKCNVTFTRKEIENALIILENNVNEQLAKFDSVV
ncbi:MAG: hypothetical protein FWC41_11225 [Firmicutes bacterium]|nr:hypothetical protein [Bacillota bacterium]